jgi:glutathione peroxidase
MILLKKGSLNRCVLSVFCFLFISHCPSICRAANNGEISSLYQIPVTTVDGKNTDLSSYKGSVLLIVNTASQCGFTPQYEQLEAIAVKYRSQGLVVLGFPSNDFGGQEPGSNSEIKRFCQLKYKVDFPLFTKNHVIGDHRQPVFSWLKKNAPTHEEVGWNFEKFLVDRSGKVTARYKSQITPDDEQLKQSIEKALSSN